MTNSFSGQQQPSTSGNWIQTHPMTILIIVAVAIFGALFIKKQQAATTAATTTTAANTSGLSTDASGNPIVYRDVADTFINKTINDTTTTNSGNTTTTVNPAAPVEHPIEPQQQTAYVRGRYASPQVMTYDKVHPNGVPIRATPDGVVLREQAYGSQVTIVAASVTGKSNLTTSGTGTIVTGSASWLPVAGGGYISAYDITGLSQ